MYNIVELFSGIGSQAKAITNLDMRIGKSFTCEWDIHALSAYDAIHNTPNIPFEMLKLTKEELLAELSRYTLSNDGKAAMEYGVLKILILNGFMKKISQKLIMLIQDLVLLL